ncbi:hypothetical protein [Robertkochia solimangrovi]|uniref:hypothetical protein n=1 Tax=Robertkochia solimangrovi TaxID=2213046 RepID=UPI00117E9311|nr:hypothetical protein [Robertkochia solimangrovi]TRZ45741.1 hypothetical protein DMZ48_00215 [Robertkochia solimangrovi]
MIIFKRIHTVLLLLTFLLSGILVALGQDTHYWSQQFGTRTALMSGAVIGGANDNTMIWYNPGGLGFLENASISINANAYRLENIKIYNALGDRGDFKSKNLGSVPLLVGGMINLKNSEWKLGYTIVVPMDFKFKGIARVDGNFNVIDDAISPGNEELVGESALSNKVNEVVGGIGIGRKIGDNLSVGLTNLITVRSHTYNRSYSAYIFQNNAEESFIGGNLLQNVDYYNIRYSMKLGLIYRMEPWSFGITLTTPSLNIGGQGTTAANVAAKNVLFEDGERKSGVATDRQAELKTKYKSPASLAVGVNYDSGKHAFGIAAQYFSSIDIYDIMEVTPGTFVRPADLAPDISSDEFLNVRSAATSVLNVALGYEYTVDESLSFMIGGRSDMSYFDNDLNDGNGIRTTISSWDLYHFSLGATFTRTNSSLSLGILYSTGTTGDYEQSGNLSNPTEGDLLKGATTITQADYNSFGFLLGYTFYFRKF